MIKGTNRKNGLMPWWWSWQQADSHGIGAVEENSHIDPQSRWRAHWG